MVERTPGRETAAIRIEGAGFSHGNIPVFDNVSLEVKPGEALCLLGPNGCGKTTLLDCLLGINRLDRGCIRVMGEAVGTLAPSRLARKLAYVPQNHNRSFSFSVMDVLLMGRTPYTAFYDAPGKADRQKAEVLLSALNLGHLKDREYTRLSGGETRLIMILRALIQETPVIVMDEPTAHLDFKNELKVLEIITRMIRERGLTLVMATHFPNHAFYLENAGLPVSVCFMHQGRVYPSGPPSAALTRENLCAYYGVDTAVVSHDLPGGGTVQQVIPLQTLNTGEFETAPAGKPDREV